MPTVTHRDAERYDPRVHGPCTECSDDKLPLRRHCAGDGTVVCPRCERYFACVGCYHCDDPGEP